jgi:hypothetical protein
MNELHTKVHRMVSDAFGLLTGLPGWPERVISDEDGRIGRTLMDALLLLEGKPLGPDAPATTAPSTEWTAQRARRQRVHMAQVAVSHGHLIQAYTILTEWREDEAGTDGSNFSTDDAYALVLLQQSAEWCDASWEEAVVQ